MELLLVVLLLGIIPAMVANSKGRNFFGWYIYGCLLFIIALVHALLLKTPAQRAQEAALLRGGRSDAEELERFARLRDQGVLTEEEFQARKRAILGSLSVPLGSDQF